jgi:moderate conductance mechanosensitive channel
MFHPLPPLTPTLALLTPTLPSPACGGGLGRGRKEGGARVSGRVRGICWAAVLFLLCFALPARAAEPAAAPQAAPVSADELDRLVHTLQDDQARAKLVDELRALIAVQRGTEKEKPATATGVFGQISEQIDALSGEILAGVAMLVDAPRMLVWVHNQMSDAAARQLWGEAALAFVIVFGTAALAEWIIRRLLNRVLPRFPARRSDTRAVRALFAALGLVLSLLPILGFAGTAYAALSMILEPLSRSRLTLSILVNAAVEARLILCVLRSVLLPADAGAVFVPLDAETRNYLYIWARRFAFWAIFGYAVPEAAWWLGIPGALYALMLKSVALVLAILAVIFLLQNRAPVATWISGEAAGASGWARARRSLGEIWHVLAILYIAGTYLIYALRIEGGFLYVLRATLLSLITIIAARLIVRFVQGLSRRGFAIKPELKAQFPTLEHRANRYIPILTGLISLIVYAFAALTVLQAWNVAAFAWFSSDLGRRVTGNALSIAVVLIIALALWELAASAIERYLSAIDASDTPRRTRIRTLLPLLRTALLCVIVVMTALIVLSHIGIDIAPLLAGAGVVGVAIGFGSQALVRDVITGLFILLEDQIAVGDIVDVGRDHKGTVEAISVRSIRLRDLAGTVHTVPFSEVTSVKNLTKDFSNVLARITIAYSEDVDRVVQILREASDRMIGDETLRPLILNPFEFMGVDSLDKFSVVLLVRIRTVPGKQLMVGRAFNRLVKAAFDTYGIAWYDPEPIVIAETPAALENSVLAIESAEQRRRG